MDKIIRAAVERGATDIHIKAGDVFRARIGGELIPLTKQALKPDQTRDIALKLIPWEEDRSRIDTIRDYDCSWGAAGIGRFRVSILKQRSSFMIVMRKIPFELPTLESLTLPAGVAAVLAAKAGMVLVTGPHGSGKSTTIAAMLHHTNSAEHRHIITLENPIEYLHRDVKSSITQREIGVDTESLERGLQAALRQDPDMVVVENVREPAVLEQVLQASERGILVLSSMHTPTVQSTVDQLLHMSREEDRHALRLRVSTELHAIISLRLLPGKDSKRVLACEFAVLDGKMRSMILDPARTGELGDHLSSQKKRKDVLTFSQHLAKLVADGIVDESVSEAALAETRQEESALAASLRRTLGSN